jgi:hypothetical protein
MSADTATRAKHDMPTSANLRATTILDYQDATLRDLATRLRARAPDDRKFLQSAPDLSTTPLVPVLLASALH